MNKGRNIAAWVVTIIACIMPTWGVIGKLSNEGMMTHMTDMGFGEWLTVIAIVEAIAVITYIVPKTSKLGLLIMTGLMGGAISAHMSVDEPFLMQSAVLALVWIGAYLRHPGLLKVS